jgi:hypothetical protein
VYVLADRELDLLMWLRAALLVLPADATVSHVTAMHLYGLDLGRPWPSTFRRTARRTPGTRVSTSIAAKVD